MRLIDANNLLEELRESCRCHAENGREFSLLQRDICIVHEQPTIDAEPVRHGKWIGYAGTIGAECSVCHKWLDVIQGTAEMNYCPNCGARMEERKEE